MSEIMLNELPGIMKIAQEINTLDKNIILIYAFNCTGKTQLSVAFKDLTKSNNGGNQTGVYYNAYSEDLFYWDNDNENDGENVRLLVQESSLNSFHSLIDETVLREKLSLYKPKFDFEFEFYKDVTRGIESVKFYMIEETTDENSRRYIKISRGEEQSFVWCFFLTLFEVEGLADKQTGHFFIDDPVSSLDDHNIFVTAASVMELIDNHYKNRKIIITTHHVCFFSTLFDWLTRGEESSSYKNQVEMKILKNNETGLSLVSHRSDVFLYHLHLLQTIREVIDKNRLYALHFALLRQILENVSSFLGVGRISYVLEQIGISDADRVNSIVNTLSHKNVFRYEAKEMVEDNKLLFIDIFTKLMDKYNFVIH